MAALYLAAAIGLFYFFGYRFYSALIEKKLITPNKNAKTPAFSNNDGEDFSPAKVPVLFGHHFASIAGAGPIIGPIVALSYFGWIPTLLWIITGSIFIGAVHDYITLMLSVRNNGLSIASIAKDTLSGFASTLFSIFLLAALVLVITVFGAVAAKTMVVRPQMVIPTVMLIPTAIIFGRAIRSRGLLIPTILAVMANVIFIVLGFYVPIEIHTQELFGVAPFTFWFAILLVYAAVTSIMPVDILLQPRDYISSYNLFFALGFGILSMIIARPQINAPAFTSFRSSSGEPLWPMLFVVVACGAISGFHCLVSSGTTSKQLPDEHAGRVVGYGAMMTEGVLSAMTLMLAASALYWSKPAGLHVDMSQLGFHELLKEKGWVVVFGNSFGKIVGDTFPFIGFGIGSMIAMTTLKTFILTTLDTSTRITRFIFTETIGSAIPAFKNKYLAISAVLLPAFFLGISNNWQKIWPIFGATNQLIGAIALIVASTYLIGIKKPAMYTLIPGIFMTVTTVAALVYKTYSYIFSNAPNYTLATIAGILIVLAIMTGLEGTRCLIGNRLTPPEKPDELAEA